MGFQKLTKDESYMADAVVLASEAYSKGRSPVGAILVDNSNGDIVSTAASNRQIGNVLHAEFRLLSKYHTAGYSGMTMYTTLEPCLMCSGIAIVGKIDRVVYLLSDYWGGGDANIVKDTPYIQTRATVFTQMSTSTAPAAAMHRTCMSMWKEYLISTGHAWAVSSMLGVEV